MPRSVHHQEGEGYHLTPRRVLEVVYRVLGEPVDLDPTAEPTPPYNVRATVHYGPQQDGLSRPWYGQVYLNPPYTRHVIDQWVEKARQEYEGGRAKQLVLLLPARTDPQWFQALAADAVCCIAGRLDYGLPNSPSFGSQLAYLGPSVGKFAREAAALGLVFARPRAA